MVPKKTTLIEYKHKNSGQIARVTKDGNGELFLELDFHDGVKARIESTLEGSRLEGALKTLAKHVPRAFNLSAVRDVTAQDEGLRVEELNGDFVFVDLPPEEATLFVDVIERNFDLLDGIASR
ncbi:MAG: hypothetical protein JW839_13980 [Candidatus Lokiarchaeota archaeon]|nr:hypothetical protein [Candidatus Lokiarchaeota archaeon]